MPLVIKSARKPSYVDVPVPDVALRREYSIAVHHEKRFARAFMKVSRAIYDPSTMKRLRAAIQALKRGEMTVNEVTEVVDWYNPNDPLAVKQWELLSASLTKVYADIVEDAGQAETEQQGWPFKFTVSKAVHAASITVPINPFSIRWVKSSSADLVVGISNQQRKLLREVLTDSFEKGIRMDQVLDEIGQTVGLTSRERVAVNKRQALLESQGLPAEVVSDRGDRYAKQLLRKRSQRIARTEAVDAYSQGLDDSWQLAKDEGHIEPGAMQEWVELSSSPRTCKICKGLGGNRVPLGQPFVSEFIGEVLRPPSHPSCRCTKILVFADDESVNKSVVRANRDAASARSA